MRRLDLLLEPSVHEARKKLPGHVRQQVKRAIDSLAKNPRPHAEGVQVAKVAFVGGLGVRRVGQPVRPVAAVYAQR